MEYNGTQYFVKLFRVTIADEKDAYRINVGEYITDKHTERVWNRTIGNKAIQSLNGKPFFTQDADDELTTSFWHFSGWWFSDFDINPNGALGFYPSEHSENKAAAYWFPISGLNSMDKFEIKVRTS